MLSKLKYCISLKHDGPVWDSQRFWLPEGWDHLGPSWMFLPQYVCVGGGMFVRPGLWPSCWMHSVFPGVLKVVVWITEVKQVDICIFVASVSLAHGNLDFEMPVRPSIGNTRVSLKIYEYGVQRESRTEYKICSEKKKDLFWIGRGHLRLWSWMRSPRK